MGVAAEKRALSRASFTLGESADSRLSYVKIRLFEWRHSPVPLEQMSPAFFLSLLAVEAGLSCTMHTGFFRIEARRGS